MELGSKVKWSLKRGDGLNRTMGTHENELLSFDCEQNACRCICKFTVGPFGDRLINYDLSGKQC